jgi:hypothetical protein
MAEPDVRQQTKSVAPAVDAETVVLDTPLAVPSRGIWVGGAGALDVTMVSGNRKTFVGVTAGTLMPLAVKTIHAAGTTATNLLVVR